VNESVQERQRSLDFFAQGRQAEWRNRLIWGDKKYVLPSLLPQFAGKVNLIYIDPPFDTGADFSFNATLHDHPDTEEDEATSFVKEPSIIEQKAYRDTWGRGMDSYLEWFYGSALILRELLSDGGCAYVHLDWRLVHYVKVLLDEVFGEESFMANIIWKRIASGRKAKSYKWLAVDDIILVYTKEQHEIQPQYIRYSEEYKKRFIYEDEHGRFFWDNIGSYSQERLKKLEALGRVKYPENPNAKPRIKNYLHEGKGVIIDNIWTDISPVNSQANEDTRYPTQKPEALLERIIKASSNPDDLVLDCFGGSGTTAAVAEKNNRRWIVCDLSRFAIHTTRKRLLQIPNVKPFVVQNLGKYERQAWAAAEFPNPEDRALQEKSYRNFILELYHAEPVTGYVWLHGVREKRMVHVGAVDSPVALGDVKAVIQEFWKSVGKSSDIKTNGVDILGWEFAFDINETARQQAAASKVDVKFKKIPREVLDKKAVEQGDVHFYELAGLDVKAKAKGRNVDLKLKEFVIPPDDVPEDVRASIVHWSQWVDYWAVDWNYRDDTFHNEWQSYRTKDNTSLQLTAEHTYDEKGSYTIVVKVIDILGNDTTKALTVEIA
jgi:adenine-specific DNA-methyltransferase